MRIPSSRLDAYTNALNAQQRAAFDFMQTALRTFAEINGVGDIELLREFAQQSMIACIKQFGGAAASVACSAYDVTMGELGIDVPPSQVSNTVSESRIEATVDYALRELTPKTFDAFARKMAERAYNDVGKAANLTTIANAERDYRKGVRYARVPTGKETCGFCLMLASRGFVYKSEKSAGDMGFGFNRFHDRCDCRVVAGDESTQVDDYDPGWYQRVYADARAAVDPEAIRRRMRGEDAAIVNKRITDSICNEINKRSREWAWGGSAPAHDGGEWDGYTSLLASHGFATSITDREGAPLRMNGLAWGMGDATGGDVAGTVESLRGARADGGTTTAGHYVLLVDGVNDVSDRVRVVLTPGEEAILLDPNRVNDSTGITPMRRVTAD